VHNALRQFFFSSLRQFFFWKWHPVGRHSQQSAVKLCHMVHSLLDALCYMTMQQTFGAKCAMCNTLFSNVSSTRRTMLHDYRADVWEECVAHRAFGAKSLLYSHFTQCTCMYAQHSVLCMYAQHTVWHDYRADVGEECVAHSAFGAKSLLYSHVTQCAVYVCTTHCVTWL